MPGHSASLPRAAGRAAGPGAAAAPPAGPASPADAGTFRGASGRRGRDKGPEAPPPFAVQPPGRAGEGAPRLRVWLVRFQTLRVLRGGRRGARLGSEAARAAARCLLSRERFLLLLPGFGRFVPKDGRAVPCGGLAARGRAAVCGEQVALRGCGLVRLWSRDFRLGMFLDLSALLLLQGGHSGADSVGGSLRLMANTKEHLMGRRCSCPGWFPCPGM